jgi:acyl dehydratase
MGEQRLTTTEIRNLVGREEYFPGVEAVDKSSIRRYAEAIGDFNPLYFDDEYAKKTKYGGLIAPPTFIFDVNMGHLSPHEVDENGRDEQRIAIPGLTALRGGNEYQFMEPVRPGDTISRKRKILAVYEKKGKRVGTILFVIYETIYLNQQNRILGISRETMMFCKC